MAWREWEGMTTLYFHVSHPEQNLSKLIKLRITYAIERKTGTLEKSDPI